VIVCYASEGGWGDSVRLVPIIDALFNYRVDLVTTAPERLVRLSLTRFRWRRLTIRHLETDPGRVHSDPFSTDAGKTVAAWRRTLAGVNELVSAEVALLRRRGTVRLVISDISFIGRLVAERLGVPAVCVATADWEFAHGRLAGDL